MNEMFEIILLVLVFFILLTLLDIRGGVNKIKKEKER